MPTPTKQKAGGRMCCPTISRRAKFTERKGERLKNSLTSTGVAVSLVYGFSLDLHGIFAGTHGFSMVLLLSRPQCIQPLAKPGLFRPSPVLVKVWVVIRFLHGLGTSERAISMPLQTWDFPSVWKTPSDYETKTVIFRQKLNARGDNSEAGNPPHRGELIRKD